MAAITYQAEWNCAKASWNRAWDEGYVEAAVLDHVGKDAADVLKGVLIGTAAGLMALFIGETVGAVAGSAVGAYFSAGNPAAAMATGKLGAFIGRTIVKGALVVMGIVFLVEYLVTHIEDVGRYAIDAYDYAVRQAPVFEGPAYDLTIDLAARALAEAIGVLFSLILSALVIYTTQRLAQNEGSDGLKQLTESKLTQWSTGLIKWLIPNLSNLRMRQLRESGRSRLRLIEGGLPDSTMSPLKTAVVSAKGIMPRLVNGGTGKISVASITQLHSILTAAGFKLVKVDDWGPPGGKQLFYQLGNVLIRFKTLGDERGPRANQPHLSAAFNDGRGFDWQNDMAKFTATGKVEPKVITDPAAFKPAADFQNNPHRFVLLPTRFNMGEVDAWAGRTHFNAIKGFDMKGLPEILKTAP